MRDGRVATVEGRQAMTPDQITALLRLARALVDALERCQCRLTTGTSCHDCATGTIVLSEALDVIDALSEWIRPAVALC